jgi:hypothetical protein
MLLESETVTRRGEVLLPKNFFFGLSGVLAGDAPAAFPLATRLPGDLTGLLVAAKENTFALGTFFPPLFVFASWLWPWPGVFFWFSTIAASSSAADGSRSIVARFFVVVGVLCSVGGFFFGCGFLIPWDTPLLSSPVFLKDQE